MDDSDSEEVLSDESTEEEDWTCQECLNDDGVAADYVGCDTCEHWFHRKNMLKNLNWTFSPVDFVWKIRKHNASHCQ